MDPVLAAGLVLIGVGVVGLVSTILIIANKKERGGVFSAPSRWTNETMAEETAAINAWNPGQPDPRHYPRITREEWDALDPQVRAANTKAKERMLNKLERGF